MSFPTSGAAFVALLATVAAAQAQESPSPPPAAPALSASSATGASTYRSAFDGYRPFNDQPVGSWRQANDLVGRIGGWEAYAREGQGGAVAPLCRLSA